MKGGTNIRKSSQRRYQKRKAPPGKKKVVIEPSTQTISEAKIKEIPVPDNTEEFTAPTGYRFMGMSILDTVFPWFVAFNVIVHLYIWYKRKNKVYPSKLN